MAIRLATDDKFLHVTREDMERVPDAAWNRWGRYQRDYVAGYYRVSGSDLRGRAKSYGPGYWRSRKAVERALEVAGVELVPVLGDQGQRSLWSVDALARYFGVTA